MNARAWTPLASLALALAAAAARAEQPRLRVSAGTAAEDYSFTGAGWSQWTLGALRLSPAEDGRWTLTAGQSVVRRFKITDHQGTLGAAVRLARGVGAETSASVAPDGIVLPRALSQSALYVSLGRGFTLNPGYRFARYEGTVVHAGQLGLDWEGRSGILATLRGYLSGTRFLDTGNGRLTPSVVVFARLPLAGRLSLAPSYAYREETFQAGAPGGQATALFKAHTGRVELIYDLGSCEARAAYGYEGRSPMAYLRQYELALAARFGAAR